MKRLKRHLKSKQLRFFLLSVFLLQSGFYLNLWNVADKAWFYTFQQSSESLIIGRLAASEKEGIFFKAGLLGRYYSTGDIFDQYPFYGDESIQSSKENFKTYDSQIAGQAFLFVIFDQLSPFSKDTNIDFFRFCSSMLLAVILTLFLLWVRKRYGFTSAFIALLLCLCSHWLTVFGRNLYWVVGVLYVPFIFVLYKLEAESAKKRPGLTYAKIAFLSFTLVLFKFIFTGFELVTTTLVMFLVPFVYYAYYDRWKLKKFLNRLSSISLGVFVAIVIYFITLAFQLSFVKGSFAKGFEHIAYSFSKRTSGGNGDFPELIKRSLESTIPSVLEKYWSGIALNFNTFIDFSWKSFLSFDYGELLLLFIIFSILLLVVKNGRGSVFSTRNQKALVLTTWVSILAPLSWHIIFKGHSYIHTHTNFIAWYMPFCLFGFATIGNSISSIFEHFKKGVYYTEKWYRRAFQLGVFALLLLWAVGQNEGISKYNELSKVEQESNLLAEESGFRLYLYENKLWFFKDDSKPSQMRTRFLVHVFPENVDSLPENRKQYGYDNFDFLYPDMQYSEVWWKVQKNDMIAVLPLPDYAIKSIKTGQFLNNGIIWKTNLKMP